MFEQGSSGRVLPGTVIGRWSDEWLMLEIEGVGVVTARTPEWGKGIAIGDLVTVELDPSGEAVCLSRADGAPA